MVSGNGQIVAEQTYSNTPLVVQAKDGAGNPVPGLAITWSIPQGLGTLSNPSPATDSKGFAQTNFVATSLFGLSFASATVAASSAFGTVNFVVTTVFNSSGLGVTVQFVDPPQENPTVTGPSGSTATGAVVVRVGASQGRQTGQGIPNVALRVVNDSDHTPDSSAVCNGPNGVVLTDSTGTATCDLLISGTPGTIYLDAFVGEFFYGFPFPLVITPGVSCSYSLAASSQAFTVNGGAGTATVNTRTGCGWSATSNATWISISAGASGAGNGTVSYTVAANPGAARTGTLTIAGQTYTVSQTGATGGGGVTVTTTSLLSGPVNVFYSAQLSATGGQPPYSWSITGALPIGLSLISSTGAISGTPTTSGTYNFAATAKDSTGVTSQPQSLSITINTVTSSSFAITTASFPTGAVGAAYQAAITTVNANSCGQISSSVTFKIASGTLPNGLALDGSSITGTPTLPGTFPFTLGATSVCGNTASANLSITITGTAPQMTAGPTSLAFTVQQGVTNIPADQQISVTSSGAALSYTAAVSTTNGGSWLTLKSARQRNHARKHYRGCDELFGIGAGSLFRRRRDQFPGIQ